jgi:hypothetical protein
MSDDIWFYRYMDEFPQPPQEFIDRALTMAHNFMENPPFENAYHAQKLPGYGREIVLEDGTESTSRMTPRWELGEDFSQWVIENIYPNPVDSALSLSMGMGPVTGLHLDGSRHFTYAYLLEVSNPGQITKWWQEHGHPIQRRETQY